MFVVLTALLGPKVLQLCFCLGALFLLRIRCGITIILFGWKDLSWKGLQGTYSVNSGSVICSEPWQCWRVCNVCVSLCFDAHASAAVVQTTLPDN